ncbi:MAG: gliding motility-associated C-terminal domain-containing protein [Bacteroidota bacterium]
MKQTFFLLLLSTLVFQTSAQICDGNLGENIFTEGDFGSGTANVLVPDPQIAPGYNYQSNPPPNDGFYTITNNTAPWGSFASNWADIRDNSPDPNGYMMVVNASFTPGLFYEQQVDGLCENTLYVFTVDVYNLLLGNGIEPNVSFLLNGSFQYQTGNIPNNQQWNTYGFTFATQPGQTSLTLSLRNNAPGGNGNDLAIDNITFRPCGPEALILPTDIENICEDGSPIDLEATIIGNQYDTPVVQWQQSFDDGITWENIPGANALTYTHTNLSGGFYYYRYLLANDPANLLNSKCRVVSNIKIVRVIPKFYTIVDTLCQGLAFSLGNNLYNETGIYVDSLISAIGCDSIVTLDLTILPDADITATFELTNPSCSYTIDGSIEIDTIINGTTPYSIFINDELAPPPGNLFNIGPEAYSYTITDYFGCSFDSTVNLQTPDPFTVELGDDLQVELGESVSLSPLFSQPPESFSWQPADLVDCSPDCTTLDFAPTTSALYTLIATSENGCVTSDSIFIEVEAVRNVYIPNAFSPNGDGINDFFAVFGDVPNVQLIEELQVFDRWGGNLFSGINLAPNDVVNGWDGTARGEALQAGIYTYFAKVRFLDGAVVLYDGSVALIK